MKVLHQKLGEKFYRRKGRVEEVVSLYTAVVRMLETGDIIRIDQAYLETVLPALGMGGKGGRGGREYQPPPCFFRELCASGEWSLQGN